MATTLTVTAGVVVGADQQRTWDLAVDWSKQERWILATHTEGGHGLGASVTGRTGIGPFGFTDPMLITEWDPPNRCTVTHQGNVVRGAGIFEVRPRGEASAEFRWTERIELPLPSAIGEPLAGLLIGPVTRVGLAASLRRFAHLVAASERESRS
jgi:hypothetical protein